MLTTTFDRTLWENIPFDAISYDKDYQLLDIHFVNGKTIRYHSISEAVVFQLIISLEKERMIEQLATHIEDVQKVQ
ncbi:KTSC domain-containing protein [Gracilibacillus alcaliphilus]|uniref:KTSC domain-containing protein n=1 Tax=Gracilibacillus alcaliphilus TaxID=1401441 RepID=UPI001956DFA7|nr:KTSC domain-containing protein [Gracilibacillus alcaliphilus]MBM7679398.1 hypothetical protein [Gracilibacillus alcaliphilus]